MMAVADAMSRQPTRRPAMLAGGMIGMALMAASPARAGDQNLLALDNGTVRCEASLKDLTRISLKGDKFASVSKIQTGNPGEEFQIVNEPIRGDIYLSVGDGFKKPMLSFFGITQRGHVYKFLCAVAGDEAKQVFVANADAEQGDKVAAVQLPVSMNIGDKAAHLIKAMYEQAAVEGFEQDWRPLTPVQVGALSVQLIGLYRGAALVGEMLRVENRGERQADLTEEQIAPKGALAVSIVHPRLAPHEATTVFVVEAPGGHAS
ncbi:type-F conjugative transfer system secretin TraK [uncultured Novosphingobium sp.]|uniref:type-F conjugative transfer system secretin TraK n=2 Tax=Novosphingobium TaxID=165696 RepID=UPI00344DDC17